MCPDGKWCDVSLPSLLISPPAQYPSGGSARCSVCEEIESRQGVYFIECQNSVAYLPDPEWCTVFHQCAFGRSFAKCCGTCQHPAGMSLPTCCSKSEAEGGCQNLRLHWDPIAYTCVRPEDVYPKRNCSIPRDDSTTTTSTPEISTTTEIYSTTTTTPATVKVLSHPRH